MSIASYCIEAEWKEFNVSLPAIEVWMKANAGAQYCGNSASTNLKFWFLEEPSEEIKASILAYWDALDEESEETTTYKSKTVLDEEKEAAKVTAKEKLVILGLTASEISALVG